MARELFSLLTEDAWAPERAKTGVTAPAPTAPRGLLRDNDACVHLRRALKGVVGKDSDELGSRYELVYLYAGPYHAVCSRVKPDPTSGLEVMQRLPTRIFSNQKRPRLLMMVYM
jgi:hypothetical protein